MAVFFIPLATLVTTLKYFIAFYFTMLKASVLIHFSKECKMGEMFFRRLILIYWANFWPNASLAN